MARDKEFVVSQAPAHGYRVVTSDSRGGYLARARETLQEVAKTEPGRPRGRDVHVTFSKDGGWRVQVVGMPDVLEFAHKTRAQEYATSLGRERRSNVILHDRTGRIRNVRSYA